MLKIQIEKLYKKHMETRQVSAQTPAFNKEQVLNKIQNYINKIVIDTTKPLLVQLEVRYFFLRLQNLVNALQEPQADNIKYPITDWYTSLINLIQQRLRDYCTADDAYNYCNNLLNQLLHNLGWSTILVSDILYASDKFAQFFLANLLNDDHLSVVKFHSKFVSQSYWSQVINSFLPNFASVYELVRYMSKHIYKHDWQFFLSVIDATQANFLTQLFFKADCWIDNGIEKVVNCRAYYLPFGQQVESKYRNIAAVNHHHVDCGITDQLYHQALMFCLAHMLYQHYSQQTNIQKEFSHYYSNAPTEKKCAAIVEVKQFLAPELKVKSLRIMQDDGAKIVLTRHYLSPSIAKSLKDYCQLQALTSQPLVSSVGKKLFSVIEAFLQGQAVFNIQQSGRKLADANSWQLANFKQFIYTHYPHLCLADKNLLLVKEAFLQAQPIFSSQNSNKKIIYNSNLQSVNLKQLIYYLDPLICKPDGYHLPFFANREQFLLYIITNYSQSEWHEVFKHIAADDLQRNFLGEYSDIINLLANKLIFKNKSSLYNALIIYSATHFYAVIDNPQKAEACIFIKRYIEQSKPLKLFANALDDLKDETVLSMLSGKRFPAILQAIYTLQEHSFAANTTLHQEKLKLVKKELLNLPPSTWPIAFKKISDAELKVMFNIPLLKDLTHHDFNLEKLLVPTRNQADGQYNRLIFYIWNEIYWRERRRHNDNYTAILTMHNRAAKRQAYLTMQKALMTNHDLAKIYQILQASASWQVMQSGEYSGIVSSLKKKIVPDLGWSLVALPLQQWEQKYQQEIAASLQAISAHYTVTDILSFLIASTELLDYNLAISFIALSYYIGLKQEKPDSSTWQFFNTMTGRATAQEKTLAATAIKALIVAPSEKFIHVKSYKQKLTKDELHAASDGDLKNIIEALDNYCCDQTASRNHKP